MRLLITGGPSTGKTTLALELAIKQGVTPQHTDDLIGKLDWSAASAEVATWLNAPGDFIIEGVSLPRALRKWLEANPEGKPADEVIYLTNPRLAQNKGQVSMSKGMQTVWDEIKNELVRRGVGIQYQ